MPAQPTDPYNLNRFLLAQQTTYDSAAAELRRGRKSGHWIWYIFPQLRGLGFSQNSHFFGLASLAEAEAYLAHPILGPRLLECTQLVLNVLVLNVPPKTVNQILGSPDDLKFHSCITLFAQVESAPPDFHRALQTCFSGTPDPATLKLLHRL